METPFFTHLTSVDYEHIYEPAEDTFLLLDALEEDLPYIQQLNPALCMEIGSGSGVVITALAKTLGSSSSYLAVDINTVACKATQGVSHRNGVSVDVVNGDLVSWIRKQMTVDLLVFNPPYVVTDSEEVKGTGVARAWAGGVKGREVKEGFGNQINLCRNRGLNPGSSAQKSDTLPLDHQVMDRLFLDLPHLLSAQGVFYLVVISDNCLEEIEHILARLGFSMTVLGDRKIRGEHLLLGLALTSLSSAPDLFPLGFDPTSTRLLRSRGTPLGHEIRIAQERLSDTHSIGSSIGRHYPISTYMAYGEVPSECKEVL
uniref:Methyltransferase HEMK2 n=1 Tax=Timema tahoe TaxID=61484 RepID=A0A7R9FM02_9NEOP|nr:unnamed protein product [Timema tahoe]